MVRFIYIGEQVCEEYKSFSFWDTITDKYIMFSGNQMWDNVDDFIYDWTNAEIKHSEIKRFLRLITIPE